MAPHAQRTPQAKEQDGPRHGIGLHRLIAPRCPASLTPLKPTPRTQHEGQSDSESLSQSSGGCRQSHPPPPLASALIVQSAFTRNRGPMGRTGH